MATVSASPSADAALPFTISGILSAYRLGQLTPSDIVRATLARIDAFDRDEVWIARFAPSILLDRAAALDALLTEHGAAILERMPLFGIPFAVKDNIDVAELQTTAGCPPFAYEPAGSAFAVQCLLNSGAIAIGKTNLDQFATGLVGTRSPYGAVRNTFAPERVSGGSSSGSAVAVAGRCVAFSLGTDTAGSGRVPAGFNGLVGLKPSLGLVSKAGVVPACRTLDTISIFAHDVDDAWRVLTQMARFDENDAYARRVTPLGLPHAPLRLGVPDTLAFYGDTHAEAAFANTRTAILDTLGCAAETIPFAPLARVSALLYDGPWVAERRAAVGAFFDQSHDAIDPTVAKVIAKADNFSAVDAFNGLYELAELRRSAEALFETIDVLLVPTTPTHPLIADVQADPIALNSQLGYYTNFVNLLDLAALSVPCLARDDGLPAGVTLIAPSGADRRLAVLGAQIQASFAGRASRHAAALTTQGIAATADAFSPNEMPLPFQEPTVALAVVGAHLRGQPLNWQLQEAGARFIKTAHTAPIYRLYALRNTVPMKPGLMRVDAANSAAPAGQAIEVEVWEVPLRTFGKFVMDVPAPLGIGTVQLQDAVQIGDTPASNTVKGFICEAAALSGDPAITPDITSFVGWRAYLQS
ncbi:allophanate hydrolase [Robbsia sp. KACC 23696]|uniref:allophanate hydrolase n=1 Tax=Robbsia sp. KACC 23696 TaxID=3149231 RepID=UPI00325BDCAD